jgi:hypothetical protein
VRLARYLNHAVAHQNHAVIVFDPPRTVAETQTHVVTPATTQVVTPRLRRIVSSIVLANPPKPDMFVSIRFHLVVISAPQVPSAQWVRLPYAGSSHSRQNGKAASE